MGRVYGVEWSQGTSVILQKLANLTAVKKTTSPSAFLSMSSQFQGSSDLNHYYNCCGELYSMTSVISDESRGRSMNQQVNPSKSLTDRSRSRDASPGNTGRSQSPGYRGQQVYGGQNTQQPKFCFDFQSATGCSRSDCRFVHEKAPAGWKPPSSFRSRLEILCRSRSLPCVIVQVHHTSPLVSLTLSIRNRESARGTCACSL